MCHLLYALCLVNGVTLLFVIVRQKKHAIRKCIFKKFSEMEIIFGRYNERPENPEKNREDRRLGLGRGGVELFRPRGVIGRGP